MLMADDRSIYAALYNVQGARPYFRFVELQHPQGLIPPPTIELAVAGAPEGDVAITHSFTYVTTWPATDRRRPSLQATLAHQHSVTQQTISRWMQEPAPELAH
jgi:hypothetical protein